MLLLVIFQSAVAADTHGDGLRARYQQEIEQLRALCEKGLMAMESSHRRIVREMEEKHRAEREQLRLVTTIKPLKNIFWEHNFREQTAPHYLISQTEPD